MIQFQQEKEIFKVKSKEVKDFNSYITNYQ